MTENNDVHRRLEKAVEARKALRANKGAIAESEMIGNVLYGPGGDFIKQLTKAARAKCLDCTAGNAKYILWCTCDGVHGTACQNWPVRFGMGPAAAARKYGPMVVTPEAMPPADMNLDDLPQKPPKVERWEQMQLSDAASE